MPSRAQHVLVVVAVLAAVILGAQTGRAQTPTPEVGGDCCAVHNGTGCDVDACSTCVCDIDPICCLRPWDRFCVATAEDDCSADCLCDRTPTPTPTPGGDCCSPHPGTGCDVSACQACVCGGDPTCCNMVWDATCVAEASSDCLSDCPCTAPPTETPAPTPTPGGDCCTAHGGSQCDDSACEACVCDLDPECCRGVWDADCASQAAVECAPACACPGTGDCCEAHGGVSCDDVRCKTCVCDVDAACCTDGWDQTCVDEATVDCQIDCACDTAGDCCAGHDGIGCEDATCQDCVCALDAACCSDVWDSRCADEAATDCAQRCGACALGDCCEARQQPGCADDPCQACVCNVDSFCCNELWDPGCVDIADNDCPDECGCSAAPACPGDCGGDGTVAVNELIVAVNIALGNASVADCSAIDTSGDGQVTVNELIQAVNAALNGCPA